MYGVFQISPKGSFGVCQDVLDETLPLLLLFSLGNPKLRALFADNIFGRNIVPNKARQPPNIPNPAKKYGK